jgi:hypothetical protein
MYEGLYGFWPQSHQKCFTWKHFYPIGAKNLAGPHTSGGLQLFSDRLASADEPVLPAYMFDGLVLMGQADEGSPQFGRALGVVAVLFFESFASRLSNASTARCEIS